MDELSIIRPTEILRSKIPELRKGAKHPQDNFDFTSKIGGRPNTALSHLLIKIIEDLCKILIKLCTISGYGYGYHDLKFSS